MTYVLEIQWSGGVDGEETELEGSYVKTFDPNARDGRGDITTTFDKSSAMRFPDAGAALAFWKQQSAVRPLRDDGKPNRPLTAFTMSVEPL